MNIHLNDAAAALGMIIVICTAFTICLWIVTRDQ